MSTTRDSAQPATSKASARNFWRSRTRRATNIRRSSPDATSKWGIGVNEFGTLEDTLGYCSVPPEFTTMLDYGPTT